MNSCYKKSGEGKPIVFLHGWGCDGDIFAPVTERLKNVLSITVDFAGFGKSNPPPSNGWGVSDYALEIKEIFDTENLRSATIVAHSFGCRVAMFFAATYPEYVERMILVAPAGLRKFSFKRWWKVRRYRCRKFLHSVGLAEKPSNCGSADYAACSEAMKNTFVKVVNQDLSFYAKRVKCRTLIVNGKQDTETPITHARKLNKIIKGSNLAEIEGGHFSFFYNPKAFADTIQMFAEIKN